MISLKILEVKQFMAKLLTNTIFDSFYLKELEISTFTTFHITGAFHEEFFNTDEMEARGNRKIVYWSDTRGIALTMIKGNKSPLSMRIVFQLPMERLEQLIQSTGGKLRMEDIGGLYLNIRFDKGELVLVTAIAIKTFTLDKTLELEWDSYVKAFLKEQGIPFDTII